MTGCCMRSGHDHFLRHNLHFFLHQPYLIWCHISWFSDVIVKEVTTTRSEATTAVLMMTATFLVWPHGDRAVDRVVASTAGGVQSVQVRTQYSDKHLRTVHCNCRHLCHFPSTSFSFIPSFLFSTKFYVLCRKWLLRIFDKSCGVH